VSRPDKAERARRQRLAAERRQADEESRHARDEERQIALSAGADEAYAAEAAAEAAREFERAWAALDEVDAMVARYETEPVEVGDVLEHLREILRAAQHRNHVLDEGPRSWCGTGE
jgi:hypothetical protein